MSAISIHPTDAALGAIIEGVDLSRVPNAGTIDTIESALEKHGVLIFPDQRISPAEQVAFSRALGPLEATANIDARLNGQPEIFVIGNTGVRPVSFAPQHGSEDLEWHTDHIHKPVPARASLLYGKEIPDTGGDTLFACLYSAYDALSPADKSKYETLEAVHSIEGLRAYLHKQAGEKGYEPGRQEAMPECVKWPLVRRHPTTGRRGLYFGAKVTVGITGWPREEGLRFISELTEHTTQPAFVYRHVWRKNDAVLWDNRRVLHAATPFDMSRQRRLMHRTTLRETTPIA